MTEQENKKLLMTLGLCFKAGYAICGTDLICDALKNAKKPPILVLEASDTSENTHKRISDRCTFYNTEHIRLDVSSSDLGAAFGKKSLIAAVGITDIGFCRSIKTKLNLN